MYPNSSDTPSARGGELVPYFNPHKEPEVLEGFIVEGPFKLNPGGRTVRPGRVIFDPPVFIPPTAEDIRRAAEAMTRGFEVFATWIDEAALAFRKFGEAAREAGLVPEEPPTDPRARALWMKQQRNHGPETPKNWRKR